MTHLLAGVPSYLAENERLQTEVASLETSLQHAHVQMFGFGPMPDPTGIIGKLESEIRNLRDLVARWPANNCDPSNECYDDCYDAWVNERKELIALWPTFC